jgi:hypothetical protein
MSTPDIKQHIKFRHHNRYQGRCKDREEREAFEQLKEIPHLFN